MRIQLELPLRHRATGRDARGFLHRGRQLLDAVLADDPEGRVACETLITTGLVVVAGEITTETYVDIPRLVRERIREIGYTRAKYGFDAMMQGKRLAIPGFTNKVIAQANRFAPRAFTAKVARLLQESRN